MFRCSFSKTRWCFRWTIHLLFPGGLSECNAKQLEAPKTNLSVGCFSWLKMWRVTTSKWIWMLQTRFQTNKAKKTPNAKFPDQERHIGLAFEMRETVFFGQSFSWFCLISTPWKMSGLGGGGVVKTPLSRKQAGWREISGNSWWFNIENPCNVWQPTKKHISWQVFNKTRVGWRYTPCDSKRPFDSPIGGHDSHFKRVTFSPSQKGHFRRIARLKTSSLQVTLWGKKKSKWAHLEDHPSYL